jgi:hypothetical protein
MKGLKRSLRKRASIEYTPRCFTCDQVVRDLEGPSGGVKNSEE